MLALHTFILEALAGQSPGYLASPFAACFHRDETTAGDIEKALLELFDLGYAELYEDLEDVQVIVGYTRIRKVPKYETQQRPADAGWQITDAGRAALET